MKFTTFVSPAVSPATSAAAQLALWAVCVVAGPYLFFLGFRALSLKRYVTNVPRSTARSAAIGPVEICGRAVGPYTLTGTCLWEWRITESKTEQKTCAPLFVEDETGALMVSPQGIELKLHTSLLLPGVQYQICYGETIFIFGVLQENPWRQRPSRSDELSRIGPGFVSEDEADLLRRQNPLLDQAPSMSETFGEKGDFDLFPDRILMKGKGPFIISKQSPRDALSKLGWKSLLFIWGGPIATLWGLWEILNRFGWLGVAQN